MAETDLYFGSSKPGGNIVTEQEWNQFEQEQVCRVLKEGSTVMDATGNWRDPQTGKLITEQTHLVICLHKNSKMLSAQIDSLCELYKRMFSQQSVLRVDKKVKVLF